MILWVLIKGTDVKFLFFSILLCFFRAFAAAEISSLSLSDSLLLLSHDSTPLHSILCCEYESEIEKFYSLCRSIDEMRGRTVERDWNFADSIAEKRKFLNFLWPHFIFFLHFILLSFWWTFLNIWNLTLRFAHKKDFKKPSLIPINRLPFPRNESQRLVEYKSDNRWKFFIH